MGFMCSSDECSCIIEFIKQVGGKAIKSEATSLINSIIQEHNC